MLINIDNVTPKAKSLFIKAGGKDYFAKLDSGLTAGMSIDAEIEETTYNNKQYFWIQKWKPIQSAEHRAAAQAATPGSPMNLPYMPFVSNTVAHAIAAGRIENPTQIAPWVKACIEALRDIDTPF